MAEAQIIGELPKETVSIRSTDFPIKITEKSGKKYILLLEVQTYWKKEKVMDMISYKARFQNRYKLPVRSVMLLLKENNKAINFYKDSELQFTFELIKIWQLEPEEIFERKLYFLYPFIPLMKGGKKTIDKTEEKLYKEIKERDKKSELLTSLALLAGLVDKDIAGKLLLRRKDIMIESPVYDMIKEEGIRKGLQEGLWKGMQKGRLEGKLEDARKMFLKGYGLEDIMDITGLSVQEIEKIKNKDN